MAYIDGQKAKVINKVLFNNIKKLYFRLVMRHGEKFQLKHLNIY